MSWHRCVFVYFNPFQPPHAHTQQEDNQAVMPLPELRVARCAPVFRFQSKHAARP